jgi:hypothetical protein
MINTNQTGDVKYTVLAALVVLAFAVFLFLI